MINIPPYLNTPPQTPQENPAYHALETAFQDWIQYDSANPILSTLLTNICGNHPALLTDLNNAKSNMQTFITKLDFVLSHHQVPTSQIIQGFCETISNFPKTDATSFKKEDMHALLWVLQTYLSSGGGGTTKTDETCNDINKLIHLTDRPTKSNIADIQSDCSQIIKQLKEIK